MEHRSGHGFALVISELIAVSIERIKEKVILPRTLGSLGGVRDLVPASTTGGHGESLIAALLQEDLEGTLRLSKGLTRGPYPPTDDLASDLDKSGGYLDTGSDCRGHCWDVGPYVCVVRT